MEQVTMSQAVMARCSKAEALQCSYEHWQYNASQTIKQLKGLPVYWSDGHLSSDLCALCARYSRNSKKQVCKIRDCLAKFGHTGRCPLSYRRRQSVCLSAYHKAAEAYHLDDETAWAKYAAQVRDRIKQIIEKS